MGSYDNLHIGAKVEVLRRQSDLVTATVKWKGTIANKSGDWVGLELDFPFGYHDGILNNRRYFQCRRNCGLFARPKQIRFLVKNLRSRSQNSYNSSGFSMVDTDISQDTDNISYHSKSQDRNVNYACIPSDALAEINEIIYGNHRFLYEQQPGFHLPHSVGGRLKPAKTDRISPPTNDKTKTKNINKNNNTNNNTNTSYEHFYNTFRSVPSVPMKAWQLFDPG